MLYHSDMSFSERLYGALDVNIHRIKLQRPLSLIVQHPLLYVRDMVPKACFDAVVKLHEVQYMTEFALIFHAKNDAAFCVELNSVANVPFPPDRSSF